MGFGRYGGGTQKYQGGNERYQVGTKRDQGEKRGTEGGKVAIHAQDTYILCRILTYFKGFRDTYILLGIYKYFFFGYLNILWEFIDPLLSIVQGLSSLKYY